MSKVRKMQSRKTNPELIRIIDVLISKDKPIWKDIAKKLAKPKRLQAEVNLSKIEKYVSTNEIAVVPGKVLGSGDLTKPIKIAALAFSERAKAKIESAGGKCLTLEEASEIDGQFRIIK